MGEKEREKSFRELSDLFIDITREMRLRASYTTPVVPLTQTQAQVMRHVHNHPGCSASDIAEGGGLQRANVSAALRELRGRGYITSRRDEHDGRAIRIEATALADANFSQLRSSWGALIEDAWSDDDETLETVAASLTRLRVKLSAQRANKPLRPEPPAGDGAKGQSKNPQR